MTELNETTIELRWKQALKSPEQAARMCSHAPQDIEYLLQEIRLYKHTVQKLCELVIELRRG